MVVTSGNSDRMRIAFSPRRYLIFYVLFLLAAVLLATREAMAGRPDLALVIIGGCGLLGLGAIAIFLESSVITLDRSNGTARLARRGLFRHSADVLPLTDIIEAVADTPKGPGGGGISHRPSLVLQDGRRVPTRRTFISARHTDEIVAAVNGWLGVPKGAAPS